MRQIILVRHGSALGQEGHHRPEAGVFNDPPLSSVGHDQAKSLATLLSGEVISAIFSSALRRTMETAEPLCFRVGADYRPIAELNEVYLGDWEHGEFERRCASDDPICKRVFAEERWDIVPGAETMGAFNERISKGLQMIVSALAPGQTAVAVLHAAVIAGLCSIVTGSRPFAFLPADNISLTRLLVAPDGSQSLRSFNETGHV